MNFNLDEELSEFFFEPVGGEVEHAATNTQDLAETKTSRRLPELWTRVISINVDDLERVRTYPIATDLLVADGIELGQRDAGQQPWAPLFSPRGFAEQYPDATLDQYRFTPERLRQYGVQVSQMRRRLRDLACHCDDKLQANMPEEIAFVSNIAKKMQRWEKRTRQESLLVDSKAFHEETPILQRRRVKHRPKLSDEQIVRIGFRAIVEMEKQPTIASEFRITPSYVSKIVKRIESQPQILDEMQQMKEQRRSRRLAIQRIVGLLQGKLNFVSSAE